MISCRNVLRRKQTRVNGIKNKNFETQEQLIPVTNSRSMVGEKEDKIEKPRTIKLAIKMNLTTVFSTGPGISLGISRKLFQSTLAGTDFLYSSHGIY